MVKIISRERLRSSENTYDFVAATLSDRARFIYSAAFRRLQMKAQVFSLESNASVRSRSSHSTEVAHIGIFLVTKIGELINKCPSENPIFVEISKSIIPIMHTVETACLIHDVGNPPFGHFGESAIREWFKNNADGYSKKFNRENLDFITLSNYNDFIHFDGNPQGLRIISHLQGYDGFGLNLTMSLLASTMKYISSHDEINPKCTLRKKLGYFSTEASVVMRIREELELDSGSRHPLVYLMEAADDISYCISDIEDAFEKGICTYRHFFAFFQRKLEEEPYSSIKNELSENEFSGKALNAVMTAIKHVESDDDNGLFFPDIFMRFKTNITNYCVSEVAKDFVNNVDKYFDGKCQCIIGDGKTVYLLQKILKVYTKKFVFCSDEAELIELSGFSVIYGLLDKFKSLLDMDYEDFSLFAARKFGDVQNCDYEKRLFNRLPRKYINYYNIAIDKLQYSVHDDEFKCIEFNLRSHLLIDYISGMTDSFALEVYQALNGIKVKYYGC